MINNLFIFKNFTLCDLLLIDQTYWIYLANFTRQASVQWFIDSKIFDFFFDYLFSEMFETLTKVKIYFLSVCVYVCFCLYYGNNDSSIKEGHR